MRYGGALRREDWDRERVIVVVGLVGCEGGVHFFLGDVSCSVADEWRYLVYQERTNQVVLIQHRRIKT